MGAMSELDMDRQRVDRIRPTISQRLSAAALIGECEAIVECGLLPEENEQSLRLLIADALSAFGFQHHDHFEQDLAVIKQCMDRK